MSSHASLNSSPPLPSPARSSFSNVSTLRGLDRTDMPKQKAWSRLLSCFTSAAHTKADYDVVDGQTMVAKIADKDLVTKKKPISSTLSSRVRVNLSFRQNSGWLPDSTAKLAYSRFLTLYPSYVRTYSVDTFRRSSSGFARLEDQRETYVDYAGGSLYPAKLVRAHASFLENSILGNTHSVSNPSQLSAKHAAAARAAVLAFFDAPPGYTVVFTANASAALKLIGEAFPFGGPQSNSDATAEGSTFLLPEDAHNSVHGIRAFAATKGASVHYLPIGNRGGVDIFQTKALLERHRPDRQGQAVHSLFALTGQSNITNAKSPLSLLTYASSLGYRTVVDAAALVPTTRVSLSAHPGIDAMVVSFYKMFGYPTGVGALVVKEQFLDELSGRWGCAGTPLCAAGSGAPALGRPWFAGGTVDVVQVPGSLITMAERPYERFEDGTINYLMLPVIPVALDMLSPYLDVLQIRMPCLTHYLATELEAVRFPRSGGQVVRVLSRIPKLSNPDIEADEGTGGTVSMVFLMPRPSFSPLSTSHSGSESNEKISQATETEADTDTENGDAAPLIPNSFISHFSASPVHRISLRTGCVCNPGGAAFLLGIQDAMRTLPSDGVTLGQFEERMGRELGVVRVSLGWASDWGDVWRVLEFARAVAREVEGGGAVWRGWLAQREIEGAHGISSQH